MYTGLASHHLLLHSLPYTRRPPTHVAKRQICTTPKGHIKTFQTVGESNKHCHIFPSPFFHWTLGVCLTILVLNVVRIGIVRISRRRTLLRAGRHARVSGANFLIERPIHEFVFLSSVLCFSILWIPLSSAQTNEPIYLHHCTPSWLKNIRHVRST